jgi:hypothetical protein
MIFLKLLYGCGINPAFVATKNVNDFCLRTCGVCAAVADFTPTDMKLLRNPCPNLRELSGKR